MSKDAFYFRHDNTALGDMRLVRLRMKHGWAGYGVFWAILECLHQSSGRMEFDPDLIAFNLNADPSLVASIITDFGLFIREENEFYSPRMCADLDLRQARVIAGKSGGKKSASSKTQAKPKFASSKTQAGKERKGEDRKEEKVKEEPPISPVSNTPMKPEHPTLPASYNPNGPRPHGWTDADEKKLIMGQEAKQAVKIAQHVHQGGTIDGWRRIEAGCREWKALYQARDHYDRLESPYSRCLDRVKAAYPDDDPIEKLKAITQAYVNDCQKHNRIKLNALNFIDGDRWKDDWSQNETESTANQGLCPDGSTWTRRADGRYEVTSKSGRKALMAEGWKP